MSRPKRKRSRDRVVPTICTSRYAIRASSSFTICESSIALAVAPEYVCSGTQAHPWNSPGPGSPATASLPTAGETVSLNLPSLM